MDIKKMFEKIKDAFKSKIMKKVIIGFSIFLAVLIIFQAGMAVGFHKASFSYGLGDNYSKVFGQDRRGFMMGFGHDDLTSGHGVVGKIIKISLPTFVVASSDNTEKVVAIGDDTVVRKFRDTLAPADLKVGDTVIVIGSPDDSAQIDAELIRLITEPSGIIPQSVPPITSIK